MFSSQAYLAARNALLTEYDLGYIVLAPSNPFAERLKDKILSVFNAGSPTRLDTEWWVKTFNYSHRVVQLNFVAMGLNELGFPPMLEGETWSPVPNPLVVRNIEGKLAKAGRKIQRRHGIVVRLSTSRLSLEDWGLADSFEKTSVNAENATQPHITFMSELPHSDHNKPSNMIQSGGLLIMYYENVRTIREIEDGLGLYKYPQVAVVMTKEDPLLIVRVEESSFGTSMLCSVSPTGNRSNLGSYLKTDQDTFISKVIEISSDLTK